MFLSQLKVSLLSTSLDRPLTFKEHITKLSQFVDIIKKNIVDGPGVRHPNINAQKPNKVETKKTYRANKRQKNIDRSKKNIYILGPCEWA